jgi:signal transduction histidine kinase
MSIKGKADPPARIGFDNILDFPRSWGLTISFALIAVIVCADAFIYRTLSLGMLYPLPLVFASLFLNRWQVILLAVVLALLREQLHPLSWDTDGVTRTVYVMISHAAAGLFSGELARNRRLVLRHFEEIRREVRLREEAEQQLRTLIESSPAAIVMLEPDGRVNLANDAAHRLLDLDSGTLPGRQFSDFVPIVEDLLREHAAGMPYRTAAHCRGKRASGASFLACIWFSTFVTQDGPRLAAIITDSSDDIRDLQESSLQSLLRSTRVLVGSVSHEIRNICAAIGVVHANLGRIPGIETSEDYTALGTLSQGLARIATMELQSTSDVEVDAVDIVELLEEFCVVESPTIEAAEVTLTVHLEPGLPAALGDRHGLLQVLLNLTRNSLRALRNTPGGRIELLARRDGDSILITHRDSGPGVKSPEDLFQPFKSGVDSAGLGLFVSRAIVRACGGDLTYEPAPEGCTMLIRLQQERDSAEAPIDNEQEVNSSQVHP